MVVTEFHEQQKNTIPKAEHISSLCLCLICYHLTCQSNSHGGQAQKELLSDMDAAVLEQIARLYCDCLLHTALLSFSLLPNFLSKS